MQLTVKLVVKCAMTTKATISEMCNMTEVAVLGYN